MWEMHGGLLLALPLFPSLLLIWIAWDCSALARVAAPAGAPSPPPPRSPREAPGPDDEPQEDADEYEDGRDAQDDPEDGDHAVVGLSTLVAHFGLRINLSLCTFQRERADYQFLTVSLWKENKKIHISNLAIFNIRITRTYLCILCVNDHSKSGSRREALH